MALQNTWVTYLNRSYKSIKASITTRMKSVVPEITDHSESNVFIIIINAVAGLFEQLNYYIDQVARESYISTARRYSSLIKLTRLIDYRVKAKIGATVDLRITAVNSTGVPVNLVNNVTLPAGLIITSGNAPFITERKATILAGTSSVVVSARQRNIINNDNLGLTTPNPNQIFSISSNYQDNTLQLSIAGTTWERVNTFAFSGPLDKHFIVEVDQSKQAWVVFGDGINGEIPANGQNVIATYYNCVGSEGNVESNTLTTFTSTIPTPTTQTPIISTYTVTNELPAVGGLDEEDIEQIRAKAPLSLRTLDRAVTLQDHIDLCKLVPGVGKSAVEFDLSTKSIIFYVAPEEGGTASQLLLDDVIDYFSDKKMISTLLVAKASGETKLRISLTVTLKYRRNLAQATTDIKEALQNNYGFNGSDIDKEIRRSDIIALIDNLDKVEYLSLDILTTKPYPRITRGTNQLQENWYVEVQPSSTEIAQWRITVTDPSTSGVDDGLAKLYRVGPSGSETFEGNITLNQTDPGVTTMTSTDGTLKLGIFGTFILYDTWEFKTYPYNQDHVFEDYTIPLYDESELILVVNEQLGL